MPSRPALHPVLRAQLQRHLGATPEGALPPDLAAAAARLLPLLESVSAVYEAADRALRTYSAFVTPPDAPWWQELASLAERPPTVAVEWTDLSGEAPRRGYDGGRAGR